MATGARKGLVVEAVSLGKRLLAVAILLGKHTKALAGEAVVTLGAAAVAVGVAAAVGLPELRKSRLGRALRRRPQRNWTSRAMWIA